MQKLMVALCCMLLFVGCRKAASDLRLEQFACRFTAQYADMAFEGRMERAAAGTLDITLTAPKNADGMRIYCDGEATTVSLGELSYTTQIALPKTAPPYMLCGALDDLLYAAYAKALVLKDGSYSGKAADTTYTATFDTENGVLISLEFPATEFSVRFYE